MLDDFEAWLVAVMGTGYAMAIGAWEETTADAGTMYCSLQKVGSPSPSAGDRTLQYRVVLLGRKQQRQDAQQLLVDAEKLMQAVMGGIMPCGAANIRAVGEPVGPSVTTENRSWVQIDFQVMI